MSHKKIMERAAKALKKDAVHYAKKMKHDTAKEKKHHALEKKEAMSASRDLKKRARSAHE